MDIVKDLGKNMKDPNFLSFLNRHNIEDFQISGNNIIFKIHGQAIRSILDFSNLDKSIANLRDNLDKHTEDIELKEGLIFEITKEWPAVVEECLPGPINSYSAWSEGLVYRYADLKQTIKEYFPELWETVEMELSVKSILNVKDITLPFACIILGPPSSSKTVGIELLRDTSNTFYTDSFSAKSFVSHNTSVPRDKLQQIDLLPKIKNNLFLSPELSPTFSKKDEDLIETLGILIRVLDGKGYESDSGAQGHRGYTGEYMFTWLGAAVEISRRVHKHLSTLGPKLYFYRLSKISKTEDDYIRLLQGENFGDRVQKIKVKMTEYLDWFDRYPLENHPIEQDQQNDENEINPVVKIQWDKKRDEKKTLEYIVKLAGLLAHLRGTLQTWETRDTQGVDYAYTIPIIEERGRAVTQLYNLARGHALSQGRNFITIEDISLLVKVVLSTASIERVKVFDLLLERDGRLSTSQITKGLTISNPTARRTMAEFKGLGIINMVGESEDEGNEQQLYDNTEKTMTLKPEFRWFLSEGFRKLREGYTPDLEHYFANDRSDDEKQQLTKAELKEKTPANTHINSNTYECYYCEDFPSRMDQTEYHRHVISTHPGKLAYPSGSDLIKNKLKPTGKTWEI